MKCRNWPLPTPAMIMALQGSAQNHNFVIRNVVNVLSGAPGEIITTNVLEGMKVVDIIRRIYAGKSVK